LDITTTQVNSALHPSGVAKSSTSFGWGTGGKVTSAGWQVTLCDLIWHVISRSGVVISITNCYIRFTLLYFTLLTNIPITEVINAIPEDHLGLRYQPSRQPRPSANSACDRQLHRLTGEILQQSFRALQRLEITDPEWKKYYLSTYQLHE